jgi:hypothetical protein
VSLTLKLQCIGRRQSSINLRRCGIPLINMRTRNRIRSYSPVIRLRDGND